MKKVLAILLAFVLVISMMGFASADVKTFNVTIWVSGLAKELTEKQIENFNATNPYGIKFNATIVEVSEADAANQMIDDVESGGDLYCFAQDQLARLVSAGALASLNKQAGETVTANNSKVSVEAAKSGNDLYAYPMTADNGYFMYYDKSVIPETDIDSLEKLIADCEAAQKKLSFEIQDSAWYLASFFFATGCHSEWTTDEKGEFVSLDDDFNSENGLIATKGIKKLVDSSSLENSSDASQFGENAAVLVSGTWAYEEVKNYLGDNMGVADLPSFEVDGKEYHLGSYHGCKLMGVKPQTDTEKEEALQMLAQYLTDEECQTERYEELSWGPSNVKSQDSDAVKSNAGLAALNEQASYSVVQGQISGSWWGDASAICTDVQNATDEAGLQAALDNYDSKISQYKAETPELDKEELRLDDDGVLRYYVDGVFTAKTGLIDHGGDQLMIIDGVFYADVSGLMPADGLWYLIDGGVVIEDYNGLYNDPALGWWLVRKGVADVNYNGLWNDPVYGWWLVQGGTPAGSFTGLYFDEQHGWWLIANGQICFEYTGLWNDPAYGWWLISNGTIAQDYTGLWNDPQMGWWMIRNGTIAFDYNGLWNDVNVGWWLIQNGQICFDYTGLWNDPVYGWWLIRGGQVAFDYTGLWNDPNVGWWLIGAGTICWDYNGLWDDPNLGWWLIRSGTIAFDYNGEYDQFGNTWQISNGQLIQN